MIRSSITLLCLILFASILNDCKAGDYEIRKRCEAPEGWTVVQNETVIIPGDVPNTGETVVVFTIERKSDGTLIATDSKGVPKEIGLDKKFTISLTNVRYGFYNDCNGVLYGDAEVAALLQK